MQGHCLSWTPSMSAGKGQSPSSLCAASPVSHSPGLAGTPQCLVMPTSPQGQWNRTWGVMGALCSSQSTKATLYHSPVHPPQSRARGATRTGGKHTWERGQLYSGDLLQPQNPAVLNSSNRDEFPLVESLDMLPHVWAASAQPLLPQHFNICTSRSHRTQDRTRWGGGTNPRECEGGPCQGVEAVSERTPRDRPGTSPCSSTSH